MNSPKTMTKNDLALSVMLLKEQRNEEAARAKVLLAFVREIARIHPDSTGALMAIRRDAVALLAQVETA